VNLAAQSFTGRSAMHDAKDERPAEASAASGRCKGGGNCAQCQSARAISARLPENVGPLPRSTCSSDEIELTDPPSG
jgi:hypothetical protein